MTPQLNTAINNSLALLNQGKPAIAIQNLEVLLSKEQANPDILQALGLCHLRTGNFTRAEQYFSNVTRHTNKSLPAWIYLGISQNQLGKNIEAVQSYQRALKINPSSIDALCNLALSYFNLGQIDSSIKSAKKSLLVDKNSSKAHNILGLCYRNNKIDKAVYHFKQSIKLLPGLYDGYHNLADTYIMHQMYDEAINTLIKSITHFPENALPCITLGKLYEKRNMIDEAIYHYQNYIQKHPGNISLQTSLARCYVAKQDFEAASAILTRLHEQFDGHPEVIQELSNYYILMRDYERVYNLTQSFISRHGAENTPPGILIPYAGACKQTGHAINGIETLKAALVTSHSPLVKENIHFLIADLYDRGGHYDNAFEHYNAANSTRNEQSDIEYYCRVISDIITTLDKDTISQLPHASCNSDKPVFIVGMPRSGTSLVEQIVSSHPQVYGAGEITALWNIGNEISGAMNLINYCKQLLIKDNASISRYSSQYLSEIENISSGHSRCTDKLPHNFMHIGLIELLFPNAHIVHCRRHPFDTCLSIFFKNFNENHKYARNLHELGRFHRAYLDMMEHWYRNSNLSIHNVNYETLVRQPEPYIRNLIDHIGLEWDDACLSHHESNRAVMTPSHDQATKPIYQHAVYRWKHYIDHLQPLIHILGEPEQYCQ